MREPAVRASTAVLVLTTALAGGTVVVAFSGRVGADGHVVAVLGAVLGTAIAVLGRVVVGHAGSRVDGPRIGLLVQLCGLGPLVTVALDVLAVAAPSPVVRSVDEVVWTLNFVPVLALAICFPDGRPRGFWRVVAWACALQPVAMVLPTLALGEDAAAPGTIAILPLLVLAVVAVVRRYRAADEDGRRVLTWLTATALLAPVAFLAAEAVFLLTGAFDLAGVAVWTLAVGAAVAVGVTALRGGLAGLDRGLATAVLIGAQAVGVTAVATVAVAVCRAAGVPLPGSAIVPGVVAALAFAPLLLVNRAWVRRGLLPRRRRAIGVARAFVGAVREGLEPAERVEEVLRQAVGEPALRLRFVDPEESGASPTPAGALRVLAGSHHIADVVRGPDAEVGERDLRDVLAELRLPIEVVRLRRDLGRSKEEVERSRARLLVAEVAERQRLGRDLHDGPQQALVALGMELRAAQRHASAESPAEADLARAVDLVQVAIAELRGIAHGASPAALESGLTPAIRTMVARLPVPVRLDLPDLDLEEPTRSTAYFFTSEALTNALKHAPAARFRISGARDGGVVRLRVEDDGGGGADPSGSGLTGLRDRIEAAGGRLTIRTSDTGTVLEAVLPCAS